MFLFVTAIIIALFILGIFWRRKRKRKQMEMHINQLRMWVTKHETFDPVLQRWIQGLSKEESQILLELLNGYCTSLSWELGWLFAPQIKKAPELKAALEESVIAYALAILRSLQMQEDVHAYQVYLTFEKKPKARKHRALVQQLHTKIHDRNLTPPTQKFLRWFSNKDQVITIQQAFERDPERTMKALKEILADNVSSTVEQVRQELSPPVIAVPASTTV